MTNRDAIDARVREFVADLEKLVTAAALEAVQQAISAQAGVLAAPTSPKARARAAPKAAPKAAVPAASPTPAATPGKRKKGQKRSPAELKALENKLDAWVQANPGKRIEEIGKALSTPTSDLSRPMKKLIAAGKVRTTGERRATRYYPGKKK